MQLLPGHWQGSNHGDYLKAHLAALLVSGLLIPLPIIRNPVTVFLPNIEFSSSSFEPAALQCPLRCTHCYVNAGEHEADGVLSTHKAFSVIDQIREDRQAGSCVAWRGTSPPG